MNIDWWCKGKQTNKTITHIGIESIVVTQNYIIGASMPGKLLFWNNALNLGEEVSGRSSENNWSLTSNND